MRLQARDAVNLLSGERRPAAELPRVVAMAGSVIRRVSSRRWKS